MDSVDVHDLPEDEARLVAAFVEFLRRRHRGEQEPQAPRIPTRRRPAAWPLGVKGTLSREELYDYL